MAGAQCDYDLIGCRSEPDAYLIVLDINRLDVFFTMPTVIKNKTAPENRVAVVSKRRQIDLGWEHEGDQLRLLLRMFSYLWPANSPRLRFLLILTVSAMAVGQLLLLVTPIFFSKAIDAFQFSQLGLGFWQIFLTDSDVLAVQAKEQGVDTGVVGTTLGLVLAMVFAYGVARLAGQAMNEARDALFVSVGQNAIRTIALQTFRHLHKLSLRFHLDRQTGGLSRAIERGTKGIEFVLRFMTINLVPTTLAVSIVSLFLLLNFGWTYALVTFVTVVGYIYYTIAVTEWRIKFRRQMNEADSTASTKAVDSLLNYETVKYFSNEDHEANRLDEALAYYEHSAIRNQLSLSFLNLGQGLIIASGMVILLAMSAPHVQSGEMALSNFVLLHSFLLQLYMPLGFLGFAYRETKQGLVDMEYMFNLLAVEEEVEDKPGAPPIKIDGAQLEFDAVDFGYNNDRQILHNLSFKVDAGKTTAIVGPSGSGKSTIGRLLFRFYDAWAGGIKIDGVDIRDVTQSSLRRCIGIVPQDTVLFNDSILYNIAYGRPSASRAEIVEAAKLAQIHDFIIALPDGYDTRVGERGLKLSGGERQRVSIARSILKGPQIMLFDEATSALDTDTETAIQESLEQVAAQRTTLVIAHRLSTVVNADEILVLDAGQLVERGTHAELVAKPNGQYAHMWENQRREED